MSPEIQVFIIVMLCHHKPHITWMNVQLFSVKFIYLGKKKSHDVLKPSKAA